MSRKRGKSSRSPKPTPAQRERPPSLLLDGPWAIGAGVLLSFAAVVYFHRSIAGAVADPDSFYHLGHAAAYLDGSPFDTALPWAKFSIIGALGGDLWWGFHILLLPFAALQEIPGAMATAGVALTLTLALGVLWFAVRHRWVWPWMWPLFFLVAVPNTLYRLLMVRPHVVSLLAVMVLVSALSRHRWRTAAAAAGFAAWVHASVFWMPLVVAVAYAAASLVDGRWAGDHEPDSPEPPWSWIVQPLGAVSGGILIGLLLRPHPFATLKLVYVQIFQLFGERAEGMALSFGGELIPLPMQALVPSAWLLFAPWVIALGILAWAGLRGDGRLRTLPREDRRLLLSSAILSMAFLVVALMVAGRALVEWTAFATIVVATTWSRIPNRRGPRAWATGMTGLITLLAVPWIVQWHTLNVRLNALPNHDLRQAAEWIEERSQEGDVVFHAHWDNFAALFAWNRHNQYIGGMDPIFQFAFDSGLYWKHAHLADGTGTSTTCGSFPCPPGAEEDTHTVLVEDFGARWVLVQPGRNPALFEYLAADPRFDLSLRTRGEAVFEVLP